MAVTWDDDAQSDTRTITVRFDCAREEHAHTWRLFQEHALGIAAVPQPLPLIESDATATGHDVATTAALVRTRMLSLPEAFYALTAAPLCTSFAAPDALGSLAQVWERFSRASSDHFQRHFAVHHHFRARGWRLKSGLHYGGHYVLYRGAASAFHSEYIVHVRAAGDALPWNAVQALTRVAADVKKTVLLCDVAVDADEPNSLVQTDPSVHTAGSHCSVDELLARGSYTFFSQHIVVATTAIRFWDIGATTEPTRSLATGRRTHSASPVPTGFAFALQPVVAKKTVPSVRTSTKRSRTAPKPRAIGAHTDCTN